MFRLILLAVALVRARVRSALRILFLLLVTGHAASIVQPAQVLSAVAAENAKLASLIAAEQAALDQERAELADLQSVGARLAGHLERITRHTELQATGREFAVMVRGSLRALPRPEQFAAARDRRELTLERASDTAVRAETAVLELSELEAALGRRLGAMPQAATQPPSSAERDALRERLSEQRDLSGRLQALARERMRLLQEIDRTEAELVQRGAAARMELTRLLFWLPSPPERHLIGELMPAAQWLASSSAWAAVAAVFAGEAKRAAFSSSLVGGLALALFVARARLRRRLDALAGRAATRIGSRVRDALAAIAVSAALALPLPLLLSTGAALLGAAATAPPFVLALAEALTSASRMLFALSISIWLLHPRGVAAGHFGWDDVAVRHAERGLRRFTTLFVPLIFFAALNGLDNAPYVNRETLGRLAFGAAMVVLTVLIVRLFRRASPLMRHLMEQASRSWTVRLYPAWFLALLAMPLGMLALAAAGFLTAAAYFYVRMTMTFFLVIAAGLLYGLVALWVQVQQWGLERVHHAQDAPAAEPTAGDRSGGEVAVVVPQRIDLAAIGEQTRSLLDLTLTVLLLGGMWWIWGDAVPALSTIGEVTLWSSAADGQHTASALTVARLFLATVIAAVTWVAVRNVGALLDIVLLQRLDFRPDANYAIKVIARYAITAVGVVWASDTLGIAWSNVQWLVAALGVGLGFGLQEIVANFVSGLIVLAERPVRIGDVVTIGNVTGTVSRIRARATVVIDSDNREVFVPNKGFITERVVNWTLSDTTTRLLLPFTVAYGSDVARVQRVVLEAVRATEGVMQDPSPSVFFVALGEKSLGFEARAFVRSLADVMPVRHALNAAIERALRQSGVEFPV